MDKADIKNLTVANNELARQLAINSFSNQNSALRAALKKLFILTAQQLRKENLNANPQN